MKINYESHCTLLSVLVEEFGIFELISTSKIALSREFTTTG